MGEEKSERPLLIYDGDCSFCRLWIDRWKIITGDRVQYAPYQDFAGRFPQIPLEDFKRSVQLILPSGEVLSAAHAVFRTLAFAPGKGRVLRLYEHVPGVAAVSEAVYRFVAARRNFFYRLTRWLWGKNLEPPSYAFTRWLFLRLLGLVYLIAFASLTTQIIGLVGWHGILPAAQFLEAVKEHFGRERYWLFPTLAWINPSDASLRVMSVGGAILSLLLLVGIAPVPVLIVLWADYLSLLTVGQDFMMFQWDALLLEAGFLAIFFAPFEVLPKFAGEREPSRAVLWLLRLLLFRLTFSSGLAKLLSGDPTWRHLSALNFHYETQPLPTPVAWYMHQLAASFHKISTLVMFFVELIVPFFIFLPRRVRSFSAVCLMIFQLLIALTGNYTFFNLLTIVLCVSLFDDAALALLIPRRFRERVTAPSERAREPRLKRVLTAALVVVILFGSVAETPGVRLEGRLPQTVAQVLTWLRALHIVNGYGLFAVMTTSRPEIVIEGSNDGENWQEYEFKYKPGDVRRRSLWVAPFQPRLDWQMWFAALGSYRGNRWFANLILRLLQGSPDVLALLGNNPFPNAPPRYIRALLYDYHFTDSATRRATGAWWRRDLKSLYFPAVSLR